MNDSINTLYNDPKATSNGLVCIFISDGNENRGVIAVQPAMSNMPPAYCI